MDKLLYGAAYYDEYMPYDRLEKDVEMMKKAGITTVRIAESTWSNHEPQEGVFDFSSVERVMDAMEAAGISVIIGTPTYAIPTWLAKSYPEVNVTTNEGRQLYGHRQLMDITHPAFLFYAERIIRELMKRTAHRKCVIGFQLDNETKHYETSSQNVQERFVKYLRKKFNNDLDALNHEFGLDYWSNRINAWEDFPDVRGTINGSLGSEFEKFKRSLVDDFLQWQANIVKEYRREDQFITHNFDHDWRGFSYGVQTRVNHKHAARALDIAGVDIYHLSQEELDGIGIAFGGDLTRSLKKDNYLILETEAQGFPGWTPYKGQLRLQAFSHLASGANSVMYWHWHSIHNSLETYWRGVLSHDLGENAVYKEACTIGADFAKHSDRLINLKKKNDVAMLVSNESVTALKWFGIQASAAGHGEAEYNDVMRWMYDCLYKMNVEIDFIWPDDEDELDQYKVIVVPALYSAPDSLLQKLNRFVANGGHLIASFKTGFTNENVKVSHEVQPHFLTDCFGIHYDQFTFPRDCGVTGPLVDGLANREATVFMELLYVDTAEVIARYDHYAWSDYAAITKNRFGKGQGVYIGCMTSNDVLDAVLRDALKDAGIEIPAERFPLIVRKGINGAGHMVRYYLNYSRYEQVTNYNHADALNVIEGTKIPSGSQLHVAPWNFVIAEENG